MSNRPDLALLVACYARVIHDGMTLSDDDEPPTRWQVSFKAEVMRIDAALQMAGIDTQQPIRSPKRSLCIRQS